MAYTRNDKKAEEMYQIYEEGYSLDGVARMYSMTRQGLYNIFKRRKYKLRGKKKLPYIIFNDNRYTLRNTGYYGRCNGKRNLLHRDVWELYNGSIPKGHDIHHIDGDRANNKRNNLELISKSQHASKYSAGINQNTDKTHCVHGHKFNKENTYHWKGHRICRQCTKERQRHYRS